MVARRRADPLPAVPLQPGDMVRIVLDQPTGPNRCAIEIENEQGRNIHSGVLYDRSDGKWELELRIPEVPGGAAHAD